MARRVRDLPVVMGVFEAGRCRWTRWRWWPGTRPRTWRPRWPSWRSRRVCRSWGGCCRGTPSTRRPGTTPIRVGPGSEPEPAGRRRRRRAGVDAGSGGRWSRRWMRWVGRGSRRSCRWALGRVAGSSCGSPRRPMSGRWWRRRWPRPATRCSGGDPEVTVGRCAGGGVCSLAGVGGLPQPAGVVPGVCASGRRGWLVVRAAAVAGASGGQADLCGVGAAVVAAGGGAGQCRAGVADRAGADPPVGAGPGPGLPFSRVCGPVASGGPSRGPLGPRWPDGSGQPGRVVPVPPRRAPPRGVRDPRRCEPCRAGWCSWPAAGSRSARARPTPRPRPETGRATAGAAPGSAGQVYTIGISTRRPDGRDRDNDRTIWRTLATPTRTPTRTGPGVGAGRSGRAVARSRDPGGLPGRDRRGSARHVGHLPRRPSPPALTRADGT